MRFSHKVLGVVATIAVLSLVGWFLAGWIINGAFESATQKGGLQQLLGGLEGAIGSSLARGDIRMYPGRAIGKGILPFYERNPQELQRDKKYFQTWAGAMVIAREAIKVQHQRGVWEDSKTAAWIPPSYRTDSWGHAFCVRSGETQTVVLSPGPEAIGSLECSTVTLSEDDVAKVPRGRLTPSVSGVLILVVNR